MCSGNGSENFKSGRHTYFFLEFFLRIFKGISPFKMHQIIFFPENLKNFKVSSVNLGRVGLP